MGEWRDDGKMSMCGDFPGDAGAFDAETDAFELAHVGGGALVPGGRHDASDDWYSYSELSSSSRWPRPRPLVAPPLAE